MTDKSITRGLTRRTALGGALGTAALAFAGPTWAQSALNRRKPNILFIMADDMGYADLSCFGRRDYQTPNLDRLAAQGMMFTSAYANSAVCSATRVGLITGRYQYRLRVGLEEPLANPASNLGLDPSVPTMPGRLRLAGYRTTLVGKWHMGWLPNYGPLKSGYDEFWGLHGGGIDYFSHDFNGEHDLWDGETPVEQVGYMTDLITDRTIETLERRARDRQPFFISMHFTAPHWPWEGNDEAGRAESERIGLNTISGTYHYDGGTLETYAAMMASLDANVGRVLARLEALGMDQDTIVVFGSDNGGERFSDTWPFSGRKTELLEGGLRIPSMARWPGMITAGTRNDTPLMSMDWMPTFLAIGGGSPDPDWPLDGVDLSPVLAGNSLPERPLFWRYKNKDQRAIRRGRMKYLKIAGNEFLFDVVSDPLERGNLKLRYPEVFSALKAEFDAWNAQMLDPAEAFSSGNSPANWADRFGVPTVR